MIEIIQENMGNLLVISILLGIVIIAVSQIRQDQNKGCHSGCGSCSSTCSLPEMKKGLSEYSKNKT